MSNSVRKEAGRAAGDRGGFVTNGVMYTTFEQTRRCGIRVVLVPGRVARGGPRAEEVPTVIPPKRGRARQR